MGLLKLAEESIFLYRNGYLDTLSVERKNSLIGINKWDALWRIGVNIYKEFLLLISNNSVSSFDLRGKTIAVVNSKNNVESISFLADCDKCLIIKIAPNLHRLNGVPHLAIKAKFFYSLLFLFYLPYILLTANSKYLLLLHQSFGMVNVFRNILKNNRPSKVVFTNDHTPLMRSYILACKVLEITSIYIQHAGVTKYFPPLIFDFSLLDGQISKDIYSNISQVTGEIKLVGIAKLDNAIKKIRSRTVINYVGVAINQNDDLKIVETVIDCLVANTYKVILRRHPSDSRSLKFGNNVINGNLMSVYEFIHESDFIVASDSSIHIESNSLKCRSLYYMFHNNLRKADYYRFIENSLIDKVKDCYELIEYLDHFSYAEFDFSNSNLRKYNAVIGTDLYGYSGKLIKKYINEGFNS